MEVRQELPRKLQKEFGGKPGGKLVCAGTHGNTCGGKRGVGAYNCRAAGNLPLIMSLV
jgi:hypothetical protein